MIDECERRLDEFRALRNDAWRLFEEDVQQLRHDLADRSLVERFKDRASAELHEAMDYATDVAEENKPVIVATVVALLAWFLRGPIGAALESLFGEDDGGAGSET